MRPRPTPRERCALALALALGACAGKDVALATAQPGAPAPVPTVAPAQAQTQAPVSGWPAAQPDGEPRSPGRELARPVSPRPASRCVTPTATRTGAAQSDLLLRASGPASASAADLPAVTASIENRSRKRSHAIVLPGDGSDAGWRDPVIHFTAFIDEGDGCWQPLPPKPVGRCGMFDPDWSDEIETVRPGTTRSIDPLWAWPFFQWRKGTVRLFVHYQWTGGTAAKSAGVGSRSVDLGAMAKEAPYELVSNPIDIVITG